MLQGFKVLILQLLHGFGLVSLHFGQLKFLVLLLPLSDKGGVFPELINLLLQKLNLVLMLGLQILDLPLAVFVLKN